MGEPEIVSEVLADTPALTVIRIDHGHAGWLAERRDPCRIHERIVQMLGVHPEDPKGRELWASPRPDRLLVQYHRPVDVRWLPDGWVLGHTIHPVRCDWPQGQQVRWALIGNVVHSPARPRVDGIRLRGPQKRIPHPDPVAWARSRLPMLDHHHTDVTDRRTVVGRKPDRRVTVHRAHLVGAATVLDPTALAETIRAGVGRGKAYGCGLLVVAADGGVEAR